MNSRPPAGSPSQQIAGEFLRATPLKALLKNPPPAIAVAVSGGPDSMALLHLISRATVERGAKPITLHALTIDHGLRADSAAEAGQVAGWVADWANVDHHILTWTGPKPSAAIQERAREARYAMLAQWCADHRVTQLWLGHNATDQAETLLFRLAKGSGLDGLGGMQQTHAYGDHGLSLIRPLLNLSKDSLTRYCDDAGIPFVRDPSNGNRDYARVRLRQAMPILAEEGLSEKRLVATAKRLSRAREALEFYATAMMIHVTRDDAGASLPMEILRDAPMEMRIRVVRRMLVDLGVDGYGPRLASLEDQLEAFFGEAEARKRFTLAGYVLGLDRKQDRFVIRVEEPR